MRSWRKREYRAAVCTSAALLLCVGFASGCGEDDTTPAATSAAPAPQFVETTCEVPLADGQTAANARCGFVMVPEDRTQPGGRMIKIAIVVLKATGPNPASDPLVYLGGGPGGSVLDDTLQSWTAAFAAPLQSRRDLVFFDQRGAGRSEADLACPEYHQAFLNTFSQAMTIEADGQSLVDAMRVCHDRLARAGANFNAYTSAAIAADMRDLMTALGYREWNVYGFSYGTRVALTAMRDTPAGIRSVVLDSPLAVQANTDADGPANTERALDTVLAACAGDAGCNGAYPNLGQTLFDTVAQLNAAPAVLHPLDATGQQITVVITGDRLLLGVVPILADDTLLPLFPLLIASTAQGSLGLLTQAAGQLVGGTDLTAYGMQYSVLCNEEIPFSTPEIIAAATSGVREEIKHNQLSYNTNVNVDICKFWGSKPPAAIENAPVVSALPSLIFTGEYDSLRPYGPVVAQTLSHSFSFLFPGQGHGQIYGHYDPTVASCGIQLMAQFLADPTHTPDGSCVEALPPTQFFGS